MLREHRLSLFALDSGRRVGVAEVTGTELAFAGGNVVVHAEGPHSSMITVLTMPGLAVSSSHELNAPTRLLAAANAYALLDRGDQALMVHCGRAAAVAPLRPPAAFTHAVALGYRYLETDVHATRDGMLLAFHDAALDRVTGTAGRIADLTYDDVRSARIGGREEIPTLASLFEAFPHARFNVDLKSDAAIEPLVDLIERTRGHERRSLD